MTIGKFINLKKTQKVR